MKKYTKTTLAKRPYHYGSCQPPFRHASSSRWGHQSYRNQGFMTRDGQRKLYSRSGRSKTHTFVETLFKETREIFPLAGRLKYFFEKLGKSQKRFNNPKHSQGLFYRLCRDSLPTKNTNKGKIKPSLGRTCTTRGERNAGGGCHKGDNSLQGPVFQSSVASIKEG